MPRREGHGGTRPMRHEKTYTRSCLASGCILFSPSRGQDTREQKGPRAGARLNVCMHLGPVHANVREVRSVPLGPVHPPRYRKRHVRAITLPSDPMGYVVTNRPCSVCECSHDGKGGVRVRANLGAASLCVSDGVVELALGNELRQEVRGVGGVRHPLEDALALLDTTL